MPFELNDAFIAVSTPLYAVVISAEILLSHIHLKKYYSFKETLINIYLTVLNAGIDVLFRSIYVFIILQWFFNYRVLDLQEHPLVYWLAAFCFYRSYFFTSNTWLIITAACFGQCM